MRRASNWRQEWFPVPVEQWARVGDIVQEVKCGPVGEVVRVVPNGSLPYATVLWCNGIVGRHILTKIKVHKRGTSPQPNP